MTRRIVLWGARRHDSHYAFITGPQAAATLPAPIIVGTHSLTRDVVTILRERG